jgi:hypothetical protein
MKLSKSVAELQSEHVVMELECIDRMYLNAYVPQLTTEAGVAGFVRGYLGHRFASTKAVAQMTESFVESIMQFGLDHKIDLVRFKKGQRKDNVMQARLRAFKKNLQEGVVFIGVAQEKARVPRRVRKAFGNGGTIPWIDYSSANVNFYYFYCLDEEFGPFFIKFCSYFPYTAKLCINGHEYLKCQLDRRGIDYEALDNGISWCEDVPAAQRICDRFDEQKIEAFFRKWLRRLPHPFRAQDRRAGYRYDLSILQAEFSLTQIWDRAVSGRCFFEEVIRENIDLGRPEQVQLIFSRKMKKSTVADGRCRTRIINEGVIPSLHIYYKHTHSKQYHKAAKRRAGLRTETTINNAYDFGVGRRLCNLPALRQIGFGANRRILQLEKLTAFGGWITAGLTCPARFVQIWVNLRSLRPILLCSFETNQSGHAGRDDSTITVRHRSPIGRTSRVARAKAARNPAPTSLPKTGNGPFRHLEMGHRIRALCDHSDWRNWSLFAISQGACHTAA